MEPNTFPQLQLWCPRPFGTYSQNKPCPAAASSTRKHLPYHCPSEESSGAQPHSENIPPPPPPPLPATAPPAPTPSTPSSAAALAEEGRVLLDTWYVIKPGNTKEKVAFFVAHQCGGTAGGTTTTTTTFSSSSSSSSSSCSTTNRASTMKVKGNWASDSSKAKRRRRCHHPSKGKLVATNSKDLPGEALGEAADLLSVAEMVALVEQRTALALQSFPARPCGSGATSTSTTSTSSATPSSSSSSSTPLVFLEATSEGKGASSSDCSRVAEAVARFESRHRGAAEGDSGGSLCHHSPDCAPSSTPSTTTTTSSSSSGEVRIAFRISSACEAGEASGVAAGRGSCVLMGTAAGAAAGGAGGAAGGHGKDKITCDLYQLISPSRDALPSNVEFLLASAGVKGDAEGHDVEMGAGQGSGSKVELGEGGGGAAEELLSSSSSSSSSSSAAAAAARDCSSGFHVDVVVTGVVDQCVFFGKDSAKKMKEETVRLPLQEDPPPGQLFLLPGPEELPAVPEASGAGEEGPGGSPGDPSLCRLYRHVSHDFLEIRFKIQRLLEPRQYMLLLPDHVMVKIFSYLPTQSLAALKCSCHYFKSLIETFGVRAADSRWSRDPSYRDDPCKQCKKRYQRGDVSLCRWHPKPYHHDLPYGRSYWMCCRRGDKEAPGCRLGLHDNNWVAPREEGR